LPGLGWAVCAPRQNKYADDECDFAGTDRLYIILVEPASTGRNPGRVVVGFAMALIFAELISDTSRRVGDQHAAKTTGIQISAAGFGWKNLPALAGFFSKVFFLGSHSHDTTHFTAGDAHPVFTFNAW